MSKLTIEGFQNNAMANRAAISAIGIDIPWILTARNKDERIEKTFDVVTLNTIAYTSPWFLVTHLNKLYAKQHGILNPKFLHISSQYLDIQNIDKLIREGKTLTQVLSSKAEVPHLKDSLQELGLYNIQNLQQFREMIPHITKAKSLVLLTDILVISTAELAENWIRNIITKKRTGKTGFSGEFNISNTDNIERRAAKHRQTENIKRLANFGVVLATALGTAGLYRYALLSPNKNQRWQKISKHIPLLDYRKGIFSSKLAIFAIALGGWNTSSLLASRDKHELRENLTKNIVLNFFYFVGDALVAGVGALILDRIHKSNHFTKYTNIGGLKIPFAKSISEIKEASKGNQKLNQLLKTAKINYFISLGLTILGVGIALPLMNQYITRKKVQQEDKQTASKA